MGVKIAIIGAGSAIFSLNLIKDLSVCSNLSNSTISLMDVNEERLDSIYKLCNRYKEETGNHLDIRKTTDRRECIKGADFVIHVALDYGHERLRKGWEIAFRDGYRFGGSLHIVHDEAFWVNFHQLRLMESIVNDVLEICPNAYMVMVANPVLAGVTYLKRKYKNLKLVGMCHGYGGVYDLMKVLGLKRDDVTFEVSGVNHFIWLTKFFYKGKDAFPILNRWVENESEDYFKKCNPSNGEGKKAVDLYRRFGVFPIGDTCTPGGGSWGWWYHTDDAEKMWNEDPRGWYDQYFQYGTHRVKEIQRVVNDPQIKVTEAFSETPSDEPMIPLIEALACDVERKVIVNIPNDSNYVPGIPYDFEVEVPAMISKKGVQGIHTDRLPQAILCYIYRDRIAPVEMELQAYETGNIDYLLSLVMMDPWTKSEAQAKKLITDILSMPCNKDMKDYFIK